MRSRSTIEPTNQCRNLASRKARIVTLSALPDPNIATKKNSQDLGKSWEKVKPLRFVPLAILDITLSQSKGRN